ncbi:MAG: sugar phosphate isomerase/epimerase [Actinomycetota bacterium]|nr:sugar phosphate isomerase/epimerase [Actinomycetota bacterium]
MSSDRSAHDLGVDDLVMSHFTLARHYPIDDRIAAAAAAGIAGIGLYVGDWERQLAEGMTMPRLAHLLDQHDVVLAEIEAIPIWVREGAAGERTQHFLDLAWELAGHFGSRYLQVIGPYDQPLDVAVERFGLVCDRAAEYGMRVGLEFLPFTNVRTATDAMDIVGGAGRSNGGVCVDIWHHRRGANNNSLIEAIPAGKVMAVQMNDGPMVPQLDDYKDDCLLNRLPPGDGEMDAAEFVAMLLRMGVSAPWSLEVCQQGTPVGTDHVRNCANRMRAVLAGARRLNDGA